MEGLRGLIRERLSKPKPDSRKFRIWEPKNFILLPRLKNPSRIDLKYPLLEPFVSVHVKWDQKEKQLVYSVLEPRLSQEEEKTLDKLKEHLTELIDTKISEEIDPMAQLEGKLKGMMEELKMNLDSESYFKILYFIFRDLVGMNEIEPLLHDPYIEDIGCTGMETEIYVTHRKFGTLKTNINFTDFERLTDFVIKLSERCGRYISYAMPLLDGTLPDGSRVQASLAKDVTTKGPTFSIRRFRRNPFSPVDLINMGTASPELMAYLWFLIEYDASVLVTGGVSTGKTTMLNSISMFIVPEKKIVSIEDVRELNIPHENWIPATSRAGFGVPEGEGKRYGEVDLFDLLKESFRMKPDYVIVGEVRGKEAYVLFQGMASGNPSLGTIHSGSVEDMVKRLQTPPIELSPSLIESLDVVIVMVNAREKGKAARRVKDVVEIESADADKVHTSKIFAWIPVDDIYRNMSSQSLLIRKICFERGISYEKAISELERRKRILEWLRKFGICQFEEVCSFINLYHKDPETVLNWVEKGQPPYKMAAKEMESATGLVFAKEKI